MTVALAGNPNAGKTSLFNALTGAHQHVGNYPGVTVEQRQGSFTWEEHRVQLVDLPGTYSLSGYSPEEVIAQDVLLAGEMDLVVAVVDATNLRRGLVLVTQLMQLGVRLVLCLNMADEAEASGLRLDTDGLAARLGFPVVLTVGHRGRGVEALKAAIHQTVEASAYDDKLVLGDCLSQAVNAVGPALDAAGEPARLHSWIATRLFLDDDFFIKRLRSKGEAGERALEAAAIARQALDAETDGDATLHVMSRYHGFVDGLVRAVTLRRPREDARALSDLADTILVNRVLGLPVFLAVMYLTFWLTFTVGAIPMGWLESLFGALGAAVSGLWPAGTTSPLRSLLVDGIIGGVGGVIVFLPNIVLLFLCLALLEDTGYMSRAAFIMDGIMHRFGLHGRSFIPLMSGFGCSIPGIMATRTLEHEHDRLTTMMVLPLMSCGARLPIWMLLVPAFFPESLRAPALWGIYVFGVVLALVLARLLRRTVLKGEEAPFVMELPPYRLPTVRAVANRMAQRSWIYLRKAGTVILAISVLMWAATSYPKLDVSELEGMSEGQQQSAKLRHSAAGRVGRAMEPVLAPLGFDWRIGTALIGAFAAKEVFVAQMGIVYAMGETDETSESLRGALARDYSPLTGVSLILFLLIATPCMATLAVTRRESGSWRWALLQFGGLTLVAYLLSLTVYQVGSLFLA